ncbi:MAG: PD-(D/E)XK nuclease family protein [Treponema sp.]|nr:PD-(D/E)XK nuclease family protein [Treponema sp.]
MTIIEKTLKENILDKNTVFIFNSDVALNSWTDYIVNQNGQESWPLSIEQDRFLAWDTFKGKALKVQEEGFESVPSLLRKLFARNLLERIKGGEKIFEALINSDYKENALSFTDWLSSLLPSIGRWKNLAQKFIKDGAFIEERNSAENRDLLKLYNEYSSFLIEKKLFEPAWQKAAFDSDNGKFYIVFFPELLDDFDEYKEALSQAEKDGRVRLVFIPQTEESPKVDYWKSARLELRMTALKILQERKNGMDWNDMALCVPDIENYRPYVEREFSLYQIPFVTRAGIKLGLTGAGRVFRKIYECAAKNFSYQSVRSLVLDSNIPWKNPDEMEILVRLGKESKCLVQYTDSQGKKVDPWLLDLEEGVRKDEDSLEFLNAQKFYKGLKSAATKITQAASFKEIKDGWVNFESSFLLPKEDISASANNILSRAVSLLDELISLEEKFPEIAKGRAENFSFFLNELENTQYQPQSKKRGVSVFDYKISALACIKKQFVINASQDKITVEKTPLSFLSQKERALLLDDSQNDHSEAYIKSYAINSDCVFSCAQQALDGFAIPHSALSANENPMEADPDLDAFDFIKSEKDFLSAKEGAREPDCLTQAQKDSFTQYFKNNRDKEGLDYIKGKEESEAFLCQAIEEKTKIKRGSLDSSQDKFHITPSDLKDFFPCPRKWILKDLLRVNEFSLDTDLFEVYDQGSVNHKILELYFNHLKEKGEKIPELSSQSGKIVYDGDENYEEKILFPLLEKFAQDAFGEAKSYKKSALVKEALKSQDKIFAKSVIKFLRYFCDQENFGGWTVIQTEWGQGKDIDLPPILQGRMDLVLRSPEGQTAIIDYKNTKYAIPDGDLTLKKGSTNPDGSAKELDDCQMAAYVLLWEESNPSPEDKIQKASFVSIKDAVEKKVIAQAPAKNSNAVERQDFEGALKSLKRRISFMQECLQEQNFSFNEVKRYKHCITCDFKPFCRTSY